MIAGSGRLDGQLQKSVYSRRNDPHRRTGALAAFCQRQRGAEFIAIDTEFMRDKTYWPKLCLVQIAGPEEAAAIDTLAPGLDLAPLFDADGGSRGAEGVSRRPPGHGDLLPSDAASIPAPLVDTQVAAMVCGFGDAVSYENAGRQAGRRPHRQELALHRLVAAAADRAPAAICARRRDPSAAWPMSSWRAASPRPGAPTGSRRRWRC